MRRLFPITALILCMASVAHAQNGARFDERGDFGGRGGGRGAMAETTQGGAQSLRARLSTDRSQYAPGRGVQINMELENQSGNRVVVIVPRFQYDIVVRSERTQRVVWQWSQNKRPRGTQITLDPNAVQRNQEFWDQRDIEGKRVPSGAYSVEASICPKNLLSVKIYLMDGGRDEQDNPPGTRPFPGDGGTRPFPGGSESPFPGGTPIGRPAPGTPFPGAGDGRSDITGALRLESRLPRQLDFTYVVTNEGRRATTLQFTSGQQFNIEVRRARDRDSQEKGRESELIWSWGAERSFIQTLSRWNAQPGASLRFNINWKPATLRAGTYEAFAYVTDIVGSQVAGRRSSTAPSVVRFTVDSDGRIRL